MSYLRFIIGFRRFLTFGLVLTFSSNFGQTFLIALFLPSFLTEFGLSHGRFGLLYSAATLASAALLPFFGRLLDRTSLVRYSLAVVAGLGLSCLVTGLSQNAWWLFAGILGLRMTGQGLTSHVSLTSMARYFERFRGKALAVANTGFPLGEALLPFLITVLIHSAGWRLSWLLIAGFIALAVMPAIWWLLASRPYEFEEPPDDDKPAKPALRLEISAPNRLFRDGRFYRLLPGMIVLPFVLTGVFLFQLELADARGWSAAVMALGVTGFAVGRVVSSVVSGPLVDRFGALRLYPYFPVPLILSVAGFIWIPAAWAPLLCFALAGISQGVGGTVKAALWAEIYGVRHLGAIRSLVSSLMILGTAASPVLFGRALDMGVPIAGVLFATLLLVGATVFINWWIAADVLRKAEAHPVVAQSCAGGG